MTIIKKISLLLLLAGVAACGQNTESSAAGEAESAADSMMNSAEGAMDWPNRCRFSRIKTRLPGFSPPRFAISVLLFQKLFCASDTTSVDIQPNPVPQTTFFWVTR